MRTVFILALLGMLYQLGVVATDSLVWPLAAIESLRGPRNSALEVAIEEERRRLNRMRQEFAAWKRTELCHDDIEDYERFAQQTDHPRMVVMHCS